MRVVRPGLALVTLCLLAAGSLQAAESKSPIGNKIADFTLNDFRGKSHLLADYADKPVVVVYFMGTECPLAKLYAPRIEQLAAEYGPKGVVFLGVNSNKQDSATEMDAFSRTHGVTTPLLKDLSNKIADQLGANRTPEVFVLDKDRVVRYHGRIDGQYAFGAGVGYAQPKLDRRDMAEAIDEILAGKEVSVATTEAKGCLIGRIREAKSNSDVTYSNQIARLFQDRCVECHREGQIAPFSMTTYDEVAGWGEMIAEVVREQRMPPWHASPEFHGVFANENTLSDEQKELIYTWVKNGCPEGDPADLPGPHKFTEGWLLPRDPDMVVYMSDEPVDIKAEGVEEYRHYSVDPGFTEDKWVSVAECMPGNRGVVHHIIVFVTPPTQKLGAGTSEDGTSAADQARARRNRRRGGGGGGGGGNNGGGDRDISGFGFLAGFAPGTRPLKLDPGVAKKIPAGSQLTFQMHYTPNGSPQKDRSCIGLIFIDEKDVTHQLSTTNAAKHDFAIPPHDDNHKVVSNRVFERDALLTSLFPHMHIRGKSFKYELKYPDGRMETLLDVPRYDFNWQNSFILKEPKLIPAGSEMICTAYFDNSKSNLFNPDPDITVKWGDQTWEEMMIGWYDVSFPIAEVNKLLKKNKEAEEAAAAAEKAAAEKQKQEDEAKEKKAE